MRKIRISKAPADKISCKFKRINSTKICANFDKKKNIIIVVLLKWNDIENKKQRKNDRTLNKSDRIK